MKTLLQCAQTPRGIRLHKDEIHGNMNDTIDLKLKTQDKI